MLLGAGYKYCYCLFPSLLTYISLMCVQIATFNYLTIQSPFIRNMNSEIGVNSS